MQYIYAAFVLGLMTWVVISFTNPSETRISSEISSTQISSNNGDSVFNRTVNNPNAEELSFTFEISAGEFQLRSSTSALLETKIEYSKELNTPKLTERLRQDGNLEILLSQTSERTSFKGSNSKNRWDISTNPSLPSNYDISIGAGKIDVDLSGSQTSHFSLQTGAASADINLSNSLVKELTVKAGVGAVTLDVSGDRHNNLDLDVKGGIGSLTVYVPKNTGVRFRATGLGSVDANNFSRRDGYYFNDSWSSEGYKIEMNISAGIGSVTVKQK